MKKNGVELENIKVCKLATTSVILAIIAIVSRFALRGLLGESCVLYRMINNYSFIVISLSAIFAGIFAIFKIQQTKNILKGKKLAVSSIILALFFLYFEFCFLPRIQCISHRLMCGTNLSGLGKAILIYSVNDKYDRLPSAANWCDLLLKYTDVKEDWFKCKSSFLPVFSYGFNKNLDGLKLDEIPPNTVLLFEIEGGRNISGGPELMVYKHKTKDGYGSNVLYMDMSVRFEKHQENLNWEVNSVPYKDPSASPE